MVIGEKSEPRGMKGEREKAFGSVSMLERKERVVNFVGGSKFKLF